MKHSILNLCSTFAAACATVLAMPVSIISSGEFCGRIPDLLNFSYLLILVMFICIYAYCSNARTGNNNGSGKMLARLSGYRIEKEIIYMLGYVCIARILFGLVPDLWFFCPAWWLGCMNMVAVAFYGWILIASGRFARTVS